MHKANRNFAVEVRAISGENRMLADVHLNIQIPRRPTIRARLSLARQTNAVAGINPGWYFDGKGLLSLRPGPDPGKADRDQ